MTFKHIKFEDSSTMRSLEQVARKKGWIDNVTPLHKIASLHNNDLSISTNLTENILKLCAGLKRSGLDTRANEIENKFVNYKKAQTLYETSKEIGKDLIETAHPKGSHKLSDIQGDNVIETIIDQHLANLKIIDKKPTGKLSSSHEILKAVRIILGQQSQAFLAPPDPNVLAMLSNKIINIADKLDHIVDKANIINKLREAEIKRYIVFIRKLSLNASLSNIDKLVSTVQLIRKILRVELSDNQDVWRTINPLFYEVKNAIEDIKLVRKNLDNPSEKITTNQTNNIPVLQVVPKSVFEDEFSKIKLLKNKIISWRAIGFIANNEQAITWINEELKYLDNIISRYSSPDIPEDNKFNLLPILKKEIDKENNDINNFEKSWIGTK